MASAFAASYNIACGYKTVIPAGGVDGTDPAAEYIGVSIDADGAYEDGAVESRSNKVRFRLYGVGNEESGKSPG